MEAQNGDRFWCKGLKNIGRTNKKKGLERPMLMQETGEKDIRRRETLFQYVLVFLTALLLKLLVTGRRPLRLAMPFGRCGLGTWQYTGCLLYLVSAGQMLP